MIKIKRHISGFKMNVSESGFGRFAIEAKNTEELSNAIVHYYGSTGDKNHDKKNCPICKKIEKKGHI